jgi:hypothetical protein
VSSFCSNLRIEGNQSWKKLLHAKQAIVSAPYFYRPAGENLYTISGVPQISFPNFAKYPEA